jgi:hypothetical protein
MSRQLPAGVAARRSYVFPPLSRSAPEAQRPSFRARARPRAGQEELGRALDCAGPALAIAAVCHVVPLRAPIYVTDLRLCHHPRSSPRVYYRACPLAAPMRRASPRPRTVPSTARIRQIFLNAVMLGAPAHDAVAAPYRHGRAPAAGTKLLSRRLENAERVPLSAPI